MAGNHHPAVARDGWPLIILLVIAAIITWVINPEWSMLFAVLAFAAVFKFRDPERNVPSEALGVVSPVDGVVEAVDTVQDPFLDRQAVRVRIRIHRFGCYSARAPLEGKVLETKCAHPSGPRGLRLETDEGDQVVVTLNTAPGWGRPRSLLGYGSRIGQGQRIAWLRFARIAELYLPVGTRMAVSPGRQVLAGSELVASLVHD